MKLVDVVVQPGKKVIHGGRVYREGQILQLPPGVARLNDRLGRAKIDPAGASAPAIESLPKPTKQDLRETLADDRKPAEPVDEKQKNEGPAKSETTEAPATPAPRRRNYRRRDMTAQA